MILMDIIDDSSYVDLRSGLLLLLPAQEHNMHGIRAEGEATVKHRLEKLPGV